MLKLIKIKDPSLKWKWLSEFKPETDIFIVSDIKTKLSISAELLAKHNFLPGFCVMRANEFYKELFYPLDLSWNLTSDSFVKELFSEFCAQHKKNWIKNLQNSKSFFEFFNVFLTVLLHKENQDLFSEWFDEQKHPIMWKPWFNLCQEFFCFLDSKKVLHESGLKALLLNHLPLLDNLPLKKERIFLDLSFSLDFCEKEIFRELARHKEVCILSPELKNKLFCEQEFDVYKALKEELSVKQIISLDDQYKTKNSGGKNKKTHFFKIRSKTQIEEVRKGAAQVCKWLKAGIPPKDIAILAPDMEEYWFIFKSYFKREKIPVKKSVFAKAVDFSFVEYFLSALRLHTGRFSFEDLEHFSFFKESKKEFTRFKSYYFNVPDRELAKRLLFKTKIQQAKNKITGRQFTDWVLSFWPEEAPAFLLDAVSKTLLKLPMEESLTSSGWLRLLESELSVLEVEIEKEHSGGISCLSFNALPSLASSYVFIMGLDEDSFKKTFLSLVSEKERKSILDDLSFPLPFSHSKEKENNFLWFLQSSNHREIYLSFASYDFKGGIKTPSLLYFLSEPLFSAKEADIKEKLLWDYNKKKNSLDDILSQSPVKKTALKSLKAELQNKEPVFFQKEGIKLSSHRLKVYTDCPFKYSGGKIFFSDEEPLVEKEFSALYKGKAVHKLFEQALKKYPDLQPTEEQIKEMIESIKPGEDKLIHKKQWLIIKEGLKNILNAFLEKERNLRDLAPSIKPIGFEVQFSTYWDKKSKGLNTDGDYPFEGQIDRIDKDTETNTYIIRDYKASSGGKLSHTSSWVEGREDLQLTLYAQVLQKGLVRDLPAGSVSALFYSIYNEEFLAKGFVEKDSALANLMGGRIKKERDVFLKAIEAGRKRTQSIVQFMERGQFSPKPKEIKICKTCAYRTWCRVETLKKHTDLV